MEGEPLKELNMCMWDVDIANNFLRKWLIVSLSINLFLLLFAGGLGYYAFMTRKEFAYFFNDNYLVRHINDFSQEGVKKYHLYKEQIEKKEGKK